MKNSKSLAIALASVAALGGAQAAAVGGQGTWETTLQARDLDGNGVTDAFYDTALNITWLRQVNTNGGNGMSWSQAKTWANDLSIGGYSDWRLPTMVDTGAPGCDFSLSGGTDCGYNVQTKSGATVYSEMAYLYFETLGNKSYYAPVAGAGTQAGWGLSNTANFEDFLSKGYWSGLEYAPVAGGGWRFDAEEGSQNFGSNYPFFAMAVRPGDVTAAIPEPQMLALVLLAMGGLGLQRRKRAR